MANKFIKMLFLLAAIAAIVACSDNLFGSGSSGNDVKSLRIDAENAFRRGDYKGAYKISEKIVKIDPKVSFGHFGMAKAALWMQGVNPIGMIGNFNNLEDEYGNRLIPFMDDTAATVVKNKYFQGMKSVASALAELDRRDSLTVLYEFHERAKGGWGSDTTFAVKVKGEDGIERTENWSLDERLEKFREAFCENLKTAACVDNTTSKKEKFPLSDREYGYEYYGNVLFMVSFAKAMLGLLDYNKDGCITKKGEKGKDNPGDPKKDAKEWKAWGCDKNVTDNTYKVDIVWGAKYDENGNLVIDLDNILNDLGIDSLEFEKMRNDPNYLPSGISDLNDKLDNFTGDLSEVADMMNFLGIQGGSESGDLQGDIEKYKDQAVFFRSGTRIDEDGDGCIDEDLLDGQDNDGDGKKNSNARVASIDPTSGWWGKIGINHSMRGDPRNSADIDNPRNLPMQLPAPVYIPNYPGISPVDCKARPESCTELNGNEETKMVTVIRFTQEKYENGEYYWTSSDAEEKLKVAKDTVCPPAIPLEERKARIGGCWPNYNKEKFLKYWLQRGLARDEDRARRTHPSCKNYTDLSKL
jgi:hypothetical protein